MPVAQKSHVHIGVSGWSYKHWRGDFYPTGLAARREIEHVSRVFETVEINRSFYSLLRPDTCRKWSEATPDEFVFALKGSQFLTHAKKLREPRGALANFFASGPLAFGRKLGPIVWQLPATFAFDAERVDTFFAALPRTLSQAAELAREHDHRVKHGAYLEVPVDSAIRHALEVRHESFRDPMFAKLAKRHGVSVAISSAAGWKEIERATTDFMYVRLHGGTKTYYSAYDDDELAVWAARIRGWLRGEYGADGPGETAKAKRARDVYVYFDNDALGHAPRDALRLRAMLSSV